MQVNTTVEKWRWARSDYNGFPIATRARDILCNCFSMGTRQVSKRWRESNKWFLSSRNKTLYRLRQGTTVVNNKIHITSLAQDCFANKILKTMPLMTWHRPGKLLALSVGLEAATISVILVCLSIEIDFTSSCHTEKLYKLNSKWMLTQMTKLFSL